MPFVANSISEIAPLYLHPAQKGVKGASIVENVLELETAMIIAATIFKLPLAAMLDFRAAFVLIAHLFLWLCLGAMGWANVADAFKEVSTEK